MATALLGKLTSGLLDWSFEACQTECSHNLSSEVFPFFRNPSWERMFSIVSIRPFLGNLSTFFRPVWLSVYDRIKYFMFKL